MSPNQEHQRLLERALRAFSSATGIEAKVEPARDRLAVLFSHPAGNRSLPVDVKPYLRPGSEGAIASQLEEGGVLVTEYVGAAMATRFHDLGAQFLDAAGNCSINTPPFFVYLRGSKPSGVKPQKSRVYEPSGLKLTFVLLSEPGLVEQPMRLISARAGISLGATSHAIADLRKSGFIARAGKRRLLVRRKELLDLWVEAYPGRLKPKLLVGRYTGRTGWWEKATVEKYGACWSGEVAAWKEHGYLKPQVLEVYGRRPRELALGCRLKESRSGETELFMQFWDLPGAMETPGLAPPVLVYADLLAVADSRSLEAADIVYEKRIARLIEEGPGSHAR